MAKKKAFIPLLCLTSIVFLPWCISFTFKKSLESWITNWWNTKQSEIFMNIIQEKTILKKFIEFEELFLLDEMLKEEYPETHLQNLRIEIYKETIQLIETNNQDRIHTILHFCTNIICFLILSGYSIRGNQELIILNSWVQEFIYNLSDTIKAFSILLLTDLSFNELLKKRSTDPIIKFVFLYIYIKVKHSKIDLFFFVLLVFFLYSR